MLPAAQEALKLRGGHRLDLAAKLAEREPMDARQNSAIAPFDFARRKLRGITPAHDLAFGFQLQQSGLDLIARKGQRFARVTRR